jgi:tape measure domain-containing protein
MSTFTSEIVYVVRGVDQSTGQVIRLSDAMGKVERKGPALQQSAKAAAGGMNALDVATGAALQRLSGANASIDPLRAGLASVAVQYMATSRAALASNQAVQGATNAQMRAVQVSNALAMGLLALTAVGAGYSGQLVSLGDQYTSLQGRINVYAKSAEQAAQAEDRLFAIARAARTDIAGVVALYSRLVPAFGDMGRSQEEAARFSELVSKQLAAQGATTREVEASTLQLAQALGSGVLRGDEFKSMMEASPSLMRRMAEGFETAGGKIGVPVGALRAMAEEGKLTADKVVAAIMRMDGAIEAQFAKAPKTVDQSMKVLGNEMLRAVGQEMTGSGTQQALADNLLKVADAADEVVDALKAAVQAGMALGAGMIASQTATMISNLTAVASAARSAGTGLKAVWAEGQAIQRLPAFVTNASGALTSFNQTATATAAQMGRMRVEAASAGTNFATAANQTGQFARTVSVSAANLLPLSSNLTATGGAAMGLARASTSMATGFGSFNAVAGSTPSVLTANTVAGAQFAGTVGNLSQRVTGLTAAKQGAIAALTTFRSAAGSLVAFMGGPWAVAIMAAVGLWFAYKNAISEAEAANRAQQRVMGEFAPVVAEYERAMDVAARATGRLKDQALETIAAQRELAAQMYRTARAEVQASATRLATAESRVRQSYSSPNPTAGPGAELGGVSDYFIEQFSRRDLAAARAAQEEAERNLERMGLFVENMPRGNYRITAPTVDGSSSQASRPPPTAAELNRTASQNVAAQQATARAAAAAADAETEANAKLALSLEAVDQWRLAARASADLQFAGNPAARAQAMAAIEVQADAKRTDARNEYRRAAEAAAAADARAARSDAAAAARVRARAERERSVIEQLTAAAEAAEAQAQGNEQATLATRLAVIDASERAERARISVRIVDAEREALALAAIARRFEAEREAARTAHAERLAALDRTMTESAISSQRAQAQADTEHYQTQASRELDKFGRAVARGDRSDAAVSVQAYEEWVTGMVRARQSMMAAELAAVDQSLAANIESLRGLDQASADYARARAQYEAQAADERVRIEMRTSSDIIEINRRAHEELARAKEDAYSRAREAMREDYQAYYDVGRQANDRFRDAMLNGNWDNIGNDIARMFLAAFYDRLMNDPINNIMTAWMDGLFSGGFGGGSAKGKGAKSSGGGVLGSLFDFAGSLLGGGGGSMGSGKPKVRLARGGAFDNGVVNTPTRFAFGGGQTGEMGEDGPEGILPLKRGPNGMLGVQAFGAGSAPPTSPQVFQSHVSVPVTIHHAPPGTRYQTNADGGIDVLIADVNALKDRVSAQERGFSIGVRSVVSDMSRRKQLRTR